MYTIGCEIYDNTVGLCTPSTVEQTTILITENPSDHNMFVDIPGGQNILWNEWNLDLCDNEKLEYCNVSG